MKISVVIPVLNEEDNLRMLLPMLDGLENVELIIVDGGSKDGSRELAMASDCVLVDAEKGRARQLNVGATHAKGDILYFLHADARVPTNWASMVTDSVRSGSDAGCFKMTWDHGHFLLRLFGRATAYFGPYFRGGDQSLFITRTMFDSIGGYSEIPIFEDVEIIERIRKNGRFEVLDEYLIASARRYEQVGVWKLHFYYLVLHAMYRLRMPIDRIKAQYDRTVAKYSWN